MKDISGKIIGLLTFILFLISFVGCRGGGVLALPEHRAGVWSGSTKCGEFTFVVDPDGKTIRSIGFSKLKGLRKLYEL